MKLNINEVQKYLAATEFDGWLLYDFQGLNTIAEPYCPCSGIVSRRWFVLIPKQGRPVALVHAIEESSYSADWAEKRTYSGWKSLEDELKRMLEGISVVAMEYSPGNAIPYVSRVDGGTIEMVRAAGVEVRSSANLIQHFQARWTKDGLASHRAAAEFLTLLASDMFEYAAAAVSSGQEITEYAVQQEILRRFESAGMVYEHAPIVAVGPNAAKPHYEPTAEAHLPIKQGDLLLLDIFCRQRGEETISADITWTAYVGPRPVPTRMLEIFSIVTAARDRGVEFINERISSGQPIHGWEVDDAVRAVIRDAGYGEFFTHRTGHSIGVAVHGNGVNIDNFETKDERLLEPGLGFTIEPGIYLPGEFGIRSEIDCYMSESGVEITTVPFQKELSALLA